MRSILRQDPDVILIGEIRDDETAEIAVRAALTGRLLFSTLHTNNAIGALTRFLEFGIPRSFIASGLLMVIAKRLLRKNCTECLEPYVPSEKILAEAGITSLEGIEFRRGRGCDACSSTGYKGRDGIYEILSIDREIENLIIEEAPIQKIQDAAFTKGMKTLRQAAIEKVLQGTTTLEEAIHSTV
jgi:type II secretory ATPase GspE/PulE/Tfp pilus assembly ATPase PilB-like protein